MSARSHLSLVSKEVIVRENENRLERFWRPVFREIVNHLPVNGVYALRQELELGGKNICHRSVVMPDPLVNDCLCAPRKACVVAYALWRGHRLVWAQDVLDAYLQLAKEVNRNLRGTPYRFEHFVLWFDWRETLQRACARVLLELEEFWPRYVVYLKTGDSYGSHTSNSKASVQSREGYTGLGNDGLVSDPFQGPARALCSDESGGSSLCR